MIKTWRNRCVGIAAMLALSVSSVRAEDIVVTNLGATFGGVAFAYALGGGYFKRKGLDITGLVDSQGGGTIIRNIMASDVGYGETALAAVVAAVQHGADIKIVNVGARSIADIVLVAPKDSPIKSVKDLAGKKVGINNPKSLTELLAVMMVQKAGLDPDKVQRVALGSLGGALTALDSGSVDAALSLRLSWSERTSKYNLLMDAQKDLPPMAQVVGIATGNLMRNNPDKLRKILAARREAVDDLNANPLKALPYVEKYYDQIPADQLAKILTTLAEGGEYWSPGRIEMERLTTEIDGMRAIGAISGDVDWTKIVDSSFLPKDLQK